MQVNIHQARAQLSKLLENVADGEEVVIAKAGKPVAKLVSIEPAKRKLGTAKGQIWISDDFDAPDPELEKLSTASETPSR